MVVETRYAAGRGVLLGAGDRWLLVTDPGDEAVVERLWTALGGGPRAAATVLDVVEDAFGGEPAGLVLVDLTPGTGQTVSLGTGMVRVEGPARHISLGDDGASAPLRRVVGGVVAAGRAEIRPLGPRVTAPPGAAPAEGPADAPGTSPVLIDGIPASILAARGPDGPPPPRPRPRPVSVSDSGPRDTIDPDPLAMGRIVGPAAEITDSRPSVPAVPTASEGAPAAVEPAGAADQPGGTTVTGKRRADSPPAPAGGEDHDGSTVFRPGGTEHLRAATGETVQAVWCPVGHLTPPDAPLCRTCRRQVAPQAPQRVPRPTLGGLRLPTGEVVPLDRGVVLGRRPAPVPGVGDWPHLVHLSGEHTYVSRMHVQVELDGWRVVARDLGSRGGTTWKVPGRAPERMVPQESYVLEPGHALDLADVYEVRFEVGPEVGP